MRLCAALVGAASVASSDLRALEQNRFETAALYGKRLVLITDSDKYGGSINVLKALTGEDPLRLERKHVQQSGTFVFEGLVMLASNEPLQTTDLTSGLERRRMTVTFGRVATEAEKQAWRDLGGEASVLHRELPGVVNWALALSPAEVSRLITHPPARTQADNMSAMAAGNPVAGWLMDCVAPMAGSWVQIGVKVELRSRDDGLIYYEDADSRLYPNYLTWCRRTGREPLALRRFKHVMMDMLRTLGADALESRRGAGQGIQGLRLLGAGEPPHAWGIGPAPRHQSYTGVGSVQDEVYDNQLIYKGSAGSVGSDDKFTFSRDKNKAQPNFPICGHAASFASQAPAGGCLQDGVAERGDTPRHGQMAGLSQGPDSNALNDLHVPTSNGGAPRGHL
jgi:hypothetical protein